MLTRQHIARGLAAVAAALALGFTALAGGAAQAQEIKIGFGMALTGSLAANGKQALLAMKIWEEQTNAKGGLLGRKVKLVYYDDQSNPATVPALYAKLIDIDKVDLLLAGYATNQVVPAIPVAKNKGRVLIGLFALTANVELKYDRYFSMMPAGDNPGSFTEGFFQVAAAMNPKPKTVALARADAEFAHHSCGGARENAKKYGFEVVYDKSYPPSTQDFTPIVRAVQATNPDLFVTCSYPVDSVGMVRAVNEVGFKPKMFGGAMVGLQATAFKQQLKDKLNGMVNYDMFVPSMMTAETQEFFKIYQTRAAAEGVDPLGYYLGGWGYAYIQLLGQAVEGCKCTDDAKLADYMHKNSFKTIMGQISFAPSGEWAHQNMLQVQYFGIKPDSDLETWRGMSYQHVLTPANLKTGDAILPYEKAH